MLWHSAAHHDRRGAARLREIFMRANRILGVLLVSASFGVLPVFASGGGGGGDMGSNQIPSVSTPSYDIAKEYQDGVAALKANDFKSADSHFNHVLAESPRSENTLILSGVAKAGMNDLSGARSAYKKALSVNDKSIPARRGYALVLVSMGQKDDAAKELDTLKQRATACADSCPDAAAIKAAVSDVSNALGSTDKQSFLAPPRSLMGDARSGDSAYLKAVADINQHHYPQALQALKQAEAVFGPHPDVLTYIGYTYRKMGRYDTAESYYRQALSLAPNHRGATEYYGELKVERGDLKGARQMLAKLESLCPFGCVESEDLRRWIVQGHG
jgi:tetratricopeptide (TPR) repeat protein